MEPLQIQDWQEIVALPQVTKWGEMIYLRRSEEDVEEIFERMDQLMKGLIVPRVVRSAYRHIYPLLKEHDAIQRWINELPEVRKAEVLSKVELVPDRDAAIRLMRSERDLTDNEVDLLLILLDSQAGFGKRIRKLWNRAVEERASAIA